MFILVRGTSASSSFKQNLKPCDDQGLVLVHISDSWHAHWSEGPMHHHKHDIWWSGTGPGSLTSSQTTVPAAPLSGPPTTAAPLGARFLFLNVLVKFQLKITAHLRMLHFQLASLWICINCVRYFGAASVPATSWVYDSNCPADTPPFGLGKWIEVFVFVFGRVDWGICICIWASGLRYLYLNSGKWVEVFSFVRTCICGTVRRSIYISFHNCQVSESECPIAFSDPTFYQHSSICKWASS